MARPIVLGVVGDSGAGKTTLTRGLVRVLGDGNAAHLSADDYHRYARHERQRLGITPPPPRRGARVPPPVPRPAPPLHTPGRRRKRGGAREPALKPVYSHRTGKLL